jgi:predicted membrane channel-forming protein YqfA (hemolysin III family)
MVWFADSSDLAIRIILLIWGSFIPSIFYGFGGDMEMVRVYWVMVSLNSLALFAPMQRVSSGLAD